MKYTDISCQDVMKYTEMETTFYGFVFENRTSINLLFGPLTNHGITPPIPSQNMVTITIGIAASPLATTILF